MDIKVAKEKYTAARDEYRKLIAEKGRDIVSAAVRGFLDAYPEAKAVGWTCYTPYFNDGSPCRYSVGEFYIDVVGDLDYECDSPYDAEEQDGQPAYDSPIQKALNALAREVGDKDLMEGAFGDHVKIWVTREGLHVSEYSHD